MKVLLVTGLLAQDIVKHYIEDAKIDIEVLAIKVPVAAFLTPELISKAIKEKNPINYDLIFVPGLMRGDTAHIFNAVGIPTFKGPRYAADIPIVLDSIGEVEFSTVVPACELLGEKLRQKAMHELKKVEQNQDNLLKNPGNILIKKLAVGKDFPMRIMAEIVDAALMDTEEVQRLAKKFSELGADIIDVGKIAGENRPLTLTFSQLLKTVDTC